MAKFLIGILTGIILTGLLLVIAVFAAMSMRGKPPSVAANSTLVLQLDGDIPERALTEIPLLRESVPLTVTNVWEVLRKAAADSRIKALVVKPSSLGMGWAKLQEVRADIEQFKKSGKPVYCYLKSPGAREYYLATAADRIYMTPEDWLNLKGVRAEMMYFANTLNKIGVQIEVIHAGKYKDFGDMFTRTNMSPETKEVVNSILDEVYGNICETIAQGRRMKPEQVRAIIDQGPFLSSQVVGHGLVDKVAFEDEMYSDLKAKLNAGEIRKLAAKRYLKVPAGSLGLEGSNRIALVIGEGEIVRGDPEDDGAEEEGLRAEGFNKILRRVANDSGIKGVVVRIDSPGGEVTASDEIWREMSLLGKKKPLVISMSDLAASGGYYMAMTGDPVVAYPGTYTGSIGVVYGKPTLKGLYDKLGITKDYLMRGRNADLDTDYRPLSPEGRQKLSQAIDENYREFVKKVAEARRRKFEEIEPLSQGRVWLGSQARQRGLVDELGGLDRAVELVKQKARIGTGEKVSISVYPPPRNFIEKLLGRSQDNAAESRIRQWIGGLPPKVWLKPGFLRVMTYSIAVQ